MRRYLATILMLTPSVAWAQMPGVPVLQNAWANPGIVVAGNLSGGSGTSTYAGAAGWGPASGRFQASGGLGFQSTTGRGNRLVYGARVAIPMYSYMDGALGVSAFGGYGGGPSESGDSLAIEGMAPAGVAIGYRRALGATRGFSAYASPMYQWLSTGAGSAGLFRVGLGIDAAISRSFGVTVGMELGQGADSTVVRHPSTLYGVGVSFAFGR
jgi:hypothetical protein